MRSSPPRPPLVGNKALVPSTIKRTVLVNLCVSRGSREPLSELVSVTDCIRSAFRLVVSACARIATHTSHTRGRRAHLRQESYLYRNASRVRPVRDSCCDESSAALQHFLRSSSFRLEMECFARILGQRRQHTNNTTTTTSSFLALAFSAFLFCALAIVPDPVLSHQDVSTVSRSKRFLLGGEDTSVHERTKRSVMDGLTCVGCRAAFTGLRTMVTLGQSEHRIKRAATFACQTLKVQTDKVCDAIMDQYVPEFVHILKTRPGIDAAMVCSIVLQGYACNVKDPRLEWSLQLPSPPTGRSNIGRGKIRTRKMSKGDLSRNDVPGAGPLKVLHLTDIHWDPEYKEGSVTRCPDPLCCRPESSGEGSPKAGPWGDYGPCDIPWRTVEATLHHLSKEHADVEWVIMTGDLTPHAIWTSSQAENSMIVQRLNDALRKAFPGKPVYPTIGNHEAHPLNSFSPVDVEQKLSTSWLYEAAATSWSHWLPKEALKTVRMGGYYSVSPKAELRIIAINSNLCYTLNWWQVYEHVDPSGMLKWMLEELSDAESKGQKVHILGHLPPGYVDCWSVWSREFVRIINRFRDIIVTQFYGHTHYEEYKVGFDSTGRPSSTSYVGGSVSTFTDLNPNYKIFHVDRDTMDLVDHETWIFNLTEANQNPRDVSPRWYRLYSARRDLGVSSLSPNDLYHLTLRMVEDNDLFLRFYGYYVKNGDTSLAKGCDSQCKETILCGLVTMDYGDQSHCEDIKNRLRAW